MFKNYSKSRMQKLSKLKITNITQPLPIKIYWLNSVTLSNNSELINSKMHSHSFYETHFIFDSSADWTDEEGNIYHISSGQGVLFSPGVRHRIGKINHDMFRFTLAFSPEPDSELDKHLSQHDVHCFDISPRIIDCIDTMLMDVDLADFYPVSLIKNRIFEIICEIAQTIEHNKECGETKNAAFEEDFIILKVKQYIADNKNNPLTCKEVAEYCHFNTKYLSRVFARRTGQTLLEYIHSEKIKYAEQLLNDPSLTLKQVSEMLGFANEYYFSNFFKRRSGYTPGTFRRLTSTHQKNDPAHDIK